MLQYTSDEMIRESLSKLNNLQKSKLADFLVTLTSSSRQSPRKPIDFAGKLDKHDSELMAKAIIQGCERIDPDEW